MTFISIMTPCYNEEENLRAVYDRVRQAMSGLPDYDYEHVFVDNDSKDASQDIIREIASADRRVKAIFNSNNFGAIRSSYYAMLQCRGAAVIPVSADLQDPPELIPEFLAKWREGCKVVMAVKSTSGESKVMYGIRRLYYRLVNRLSEIQLVDNYYGFGLYDRIVIETLREMDEPYPYFRGLIAEIGFKQGVVRFAQPKRKGGVTSYNFYRLYDVAMLGITSHSKVPLRLATMIGFAMSGLSFLVGLGYLIAKLLYWDQFTMGVAPIIIAIFFLGSVQLFFTGILGEYIGFIYTHVRRRPLVIEKERINFGDETLPDAREPAKT
jgi:polyisoprenyl-phosphate glycosyltransferase